MDIFEWLVIALLLLITAGVAYLVATSNAAPRLRKSGTATLVDTSVLIDGRIVAIARAGFAGSELIVPRSVIAELQYLADMADHEKRTRARHGLDVVQELQQMKHIDLKILQDERPVDGVDAQLIRLAKRYNAQLSTIDYNLNKVAQVEGVTVLNINELAQALRISYLPGEQSTISLVQAGQGPMQAVGYLPDGTMVVVENGHKLIGRDVKVEFTRNLQTQAGRMMFARMVGQEQQSSRSHSPQQPAEKIKSQPQPVKQPAQQKRTQQGAQNNSQNNKKRGNQKRQEAAVTPVPPKQSTVASSEGLATPTQPARPASQPRRRTSHSAEDALISLANKDRS
ncbi:MAG TPA: PIN domain-containing protein [Verrucomicrobiae bacterium]|nr:PIN domain-containing protein [Verrucomicrobiae bacterium]